MPETTEKATIAKNLKRLKETKTEIADAMKSKGIEVKKSHTFRQYAELIRKIDVTMDDYDPDATDTDYSSMPSDPSAGPGSGYSSGPSNYDGSMSYQYVSGIFTDPEDNGKIHYPNGTAVPLSEASDSDTDRSGTSQTEGYRSTLTESNYLLSNLSALQSDLQKDVAANKTKVTNSSKWGSFIKDNFGVSISGQSPSDLLTLCNGWINDTRNEKSEAESMYEGALQNSDHGTDNEITMGSMQLFNNVRVDISELLEDEFDVTYVSAEGTPLTGGGPFKVAKGGSAPPYAGATPTVEGDDEKIFAGWNPMPVNVQRNMYCRPVFNSATAGYTNIGKAGTKYYAKPDPNEITDTWAEIIKNGPSKYTEGQWKWLAVPNNIAHTLYNADQNGEPLSGIYNPKNSSQGGVGNNYLSEYGIKFFKMLLVAKGEDGSGTTWLSITPFAACSGGIQLVRSKNPYFEDLEKGYLSVGVPWDQNWTSSPTTIMNSAELSESTIKRLSFTYDTSYICKFLNENLKNALPLYLRNAIKPVKKHCTSYISASNYSVQSGSRYFNDEATEPLDSSYHYIIDRAKHNDAFEYDETYSIWLPNSYEIGGAYANPSPGNIEGNDTTSISYRNVLQTALGNNYAQLSISRDMYTYMAITKNNNNDPQYTVRRNDGGINMGTTPQFVFGFCLK